MKDLAPDIFRKRLIVEGYFSIAVTEQTISEFFAFLTSNLQLRTYGDPIIHTTSGQGKEANQGYDGFVPLIDSGIYLAVWSNQKFLSLIIYTCKDFDSKKAVQLTNEFFGIETTEFKEF